jgi:hypothetical protein
VNHKKIPEKQLFLQYFARDYVRIPPNRFHAVSIENAKKLPGLFRLNIDHYKLPGTSRQMPSQAVFKYLVAPPSAEQVLKSLLKETTIPISVQTNVIMLNSQLPVQETESQLITEVEKL